MAKIDTTPKYSITQFNAAFSVCVTFFKAKISPQISEMYYSRLSVYPMAAVQQAIKKWIGENKPASGNFPTPRDLAHECSLWLAEHPAAKHEMMVYDRIDDPEYPIDLMFDAYRILGKNGEGEFMDFCKAKRMPENDIKRVYDKWRYNHVPEYNAWVKNQVKIIKGHIKNIGSLENDEVPF